MNWIQFVVHWKFCIAPVPHKISLSPKGPETIQTSLLLNPFLLIYCIDYFCFSCSGAINRYLICCISELEHWIMQTDTQCALTVYRRHLERAWIFWCPLITALVRVWISVKQTKKFYCHIGQWNMHMFPCGNCRRFSEKCKYQMVPQTMHLPWVADEFSWPNPSNLISAGSSATKPGKWRLPRATRTLRRSRRAAADFYFAPPPPSFSSRRADVP